MNLLFVGPCRAARRTVIEALRHRGFLVDTAAAPDAAVNRARRNHYQVIIVELTDGTDGVTLVEDLRREVPTTRILICSDQVQADHAVGVPSAGMDDHLLHPIDPDSLTARIHVLVGGRPDDPGAHLCAGDISINREMFAVCVGKHAEINFTPSEYRLVEHLVMHDGRVISRRSLEGLLHKGKSNRTSNVIEVLVSHINRKLATSGSRAAIRSKRGFGYYLDTGKTGVRA